MNRFKNNSLSYLSRCVRVGFSVLAAALLAGATCADDDRPEKPNILLLLVDDLGWQDVKCYDIDEPSPFETPNIDALAGKGVLFWQGYSAAPTCAPSRGAIMSGAHPARSQFTHVVGGTPPGAIHKAGHRMMPPWYSGRYPAGSVSLPEALKNNGYTTGHSGKWHLAKKHSSYPQPEDMGFDWTRSVHGTTRKMTPHRLTGFATNKPNDLYRLDENGFATHQLSIDALTFVKEHKDKPFFLFYATKLVHTPIHTRSERLLKKYVDKLGVELPDNPQEWKGEGQTNPFYCAMIEELDYYVGQMFDYLETTEDPRWPGHKLSENTYIIFTSDNGGMERMPGDNITDNYPLARGKLSAMEGGTRVPLIITGPEIDAGVESDVMINGLDFYPTILALTDTPAPEGKQFDGCDITELLKKDPTDPKLVKGDDGSVRDTMLWHFPNSQALESTIRIGDYKLVHNYDHLDNAHVTELELYQLYETKNGKPLRVDIEEAKNLADSMPEKAKAMSAELSERLNEMKASYPYYNPHFKDALANKETVPSVLSFAKNGDVVDFLFQENGAKVIRAQLIYTLNGGEKVFDEEWFRKPATLMPGNKISATLPKGTTHYVINLIDENNFLVSYPDVDKATRTKNASPTALSVQEGLPLKPRRKK
ncbi:MAG: sulfatase [Lentimonas sp.]